MGRGGPMAMMKGEKPRDFKGTMRKLIQYLGAYKLPILVVMLFAAGSTVFAILGPKILGKATTKLFEGVMAQITGTGTGIDFKYIGRIILITLGAVSGLHRSSAYIQGWIMANISMDITYRFRQDIAAKINRTAAQILRRHQPRRGALAHHQRCGHRQPDAQPEPVADHHLGDHRGRRADHDAHDQLADDAGGAVDRAAFHGCNRPGDQPVAEIFQAAAGLPGARQRAC